MKRWLQAGDDSTERLLQLCFGYFTLYVVTGVGVKYYLGSPDAGMPGLTGPEFLVYSTFGGILINTVLVIALRWYRLASNQPTKVWGVTVPSELFYIIPSGVCTAVVIPTTTLMYTLPISVMVAMTIMRGSVIVISRVVDGIQIRQGILKKRVAPEENIAVVFALLAVGTNVVGNSHGGFDFVGNAAAMTILGSYISAYALRIYLMNYFKNTRRPGIKHDNNGFFAIEQLAAAGAITIAMVAVYLAPSLWGATSDIVLQMKGAVDAPKPAWLSAVIFAGFPYGLVAIFSVFIFMFKGRTATFAGLVNRLTSLVAGTAATILFALWSGKAFPSQRDWVALAFILVAVWFLRRAETKRAPAPAATTASK